MCTSIFDHHSRLDINRVSDLARLVGGNDGVYIRDGYESRDAAVFADQCLCPVDIPTTLIQAGFKVWKDPNDDPMCYHCEPLDNVSEPK